MTDPKRIAEKKAVAVWFWDWRPASIAPSNRSRAMQEQGAPQSCGSSPSHVVNFLKAKYDLKPWRPAKPVNQRKSIAASGMAAN